MPNHKAREMEALRLEYGANPAGLEDVVLLTPEARVEQRTRDFPSIRVLPIKFGSEELGAPGCGFCSVHTATSRSTSDRWCRSWGGIALG